MRLKPMHLLHISKTAALFNSGSLNQPCHTRKMQNSKSRASLIAVPSYLPIHSSTRCIFYLGSKSQNLFINTTAKYILPLNRAKFIYIIHSLHSIAFQVTCQCENKSKILAESLHVNVISLYRYMTVCMFLFFFFLVHMFFADCHHGFSATTAQSTRLSRCPQSHGKAPSSRKWGKKAKKKQENKNKYILKGHCQVLKRTFFLFDDFLQQTYITSNFFF